MSKSNTELFAPENITREHVLEAVRIIDEGREPINPSTKYDVVINDRLYPPKEVMRLCNRLANGIDEWPRIGGEATNKYLQRLGFKILTKSGQDPMEVMQSESRFVKSLRKLPKEDLRGFMALASRLIDALGVSPSDPRIAFGVQAGNSLTITVGNRYCLSFYPKNAHPYGFISSLIHEGDIELHRGSFDGGPQAYYYGCDDLQTLLQHEQEMINASKIELGRSSKSHVRKYSHPVFEQCVFDPDILEKYLSEDKRLHPSSEREIWKVGVRWEGNANDFFDLIASRSIVITARDRFFPPGTLILITDGFKVLALAELHEDLKPSTSDPTLKGPFEKYGIPFEDHVIFGSAEFYTLPTADQFEYRQQRGAARVLDPAIRATAIDLWDNRKTNYWVFQGNPSLYDFDAAIRENRLTDWTVTSHKDKIKAGDKAIIWLTGKNSGCYALATITTDPKPASEFEPDEYWREENHTELRVGIRITHDLWRNPIPSQIVKETEGLRDLKAGSQGTNFSATRAQYEAMLNLINPQITRKVMSTNTSKIDLPLNTILYGPPGTGKTYALTGYQHRHFTDHGRQLSTQEVLSEKVSEFSLWQVIAAILYRENRPMSVKEIMTDPLMVGKINPSAKYPTQIVWRALITYADDNSTNSDQKYRNTQQFFTKNDASRWAIIPAVYPEIPNIVDEELINLANHPTPEAGTQATVIRRFKFITFHQKYSYEDFIEGIRPLLKGDEEQDGDLKFELKKGIFYESCIEALRLAGYDSFAACYKDSPENRKARFAEAAGDPQKQYAIFIDEINRANISAVFGELITLLEDDKRIGAENEMWVELPYSKEKFSVPGNLYVIGTMNTADRSIALLDIALRRRFEFRALYPEYHDGAWWSPLLRNLNEAIYLRKKNPDFFIGHAFFIKSIPSDRIRILNNRIIPLLYEYCQNNVDQVRQILTDAGIPFRAGDINTNYRILAE